MNYDNVHISRWEEIPDFPLYIDQVVSIIEKSLSFLKNNGPKNILLYIDNNNELYIKLTYYSRVIVYFQNKEPQNNALSATEVDIDISTLTQVGI